MARLLEKPASVSFWRRTFRSLPSALQVSPLHRRGEREDRYPLVTDHAGRVGTYEPSFGTFGELPPVAMSEVDVTSGALTILVVEDDPVYAHFVTQALTMAGHHVQGATNGAEARACARSARLDAVILDLGLPDASGYDIAFALRRGGMLEDKAVIILLTANLFPERDVAEALDIDIVLTKPVEAEVVIGMVDLMRQRRARRISTT